MATFETFRHRGKDYRFRVGRGTPMVVPLVTHDSEYYKAKQKSLTWVLWLTFVPVIILGVLYFAYTNSDDPGAALDWLPILALPYGMMIYVVLEKIQDADGVLSELRKHAEDEEYLEAYSAWAAHT